MKVDTKGSMTICKIFGELITFSLTNEWRRSFECSSLGTIFPFFNEDLFYSVDFPFLVELNGGFDIGMLVFGFDS